MLINSSKKLSFFLPNSFTALNMACGYASIMFAWKENYYLASILLILGAVFDSVDGRIARMTGTQSHFGEEFDSISDVVSFGVAPALLIFKQQLFDLGRVGIVTSFIFLLCGALRLARFNANINKVSSQYFQGLPIPGGAIAIIGFVLLSLKFPIIHEYRYISVAYVLFYAFLMISNIPFNSFKDSLWVRAHKKRVLLIIFTLFGAIVCFEEIMIFTVITAYVLISLVYFFLHRGELLDIINWKSEHDDE